ncbi:hypothetical protein GCM10010193_70600 [Kitasatospora atroaurantiaca]|uniref:Uncharacterized protein n=1 Tax=Kitasatospora atroaurantiaca TaxID=285545 RepID=A0A561ENF0_9ACTN|nr:hypothetical protein [Kitasatospora atroaurantiaca]TWE17146.1 hypothetical protein FB465_2151 [Kitasatospora atroaurantiaca]
MTGTWGTVQLSRTTLRETFTVAEGSSDARTLDLDGQESNPPLTRSVLVARHDNILAMEQGVPLPVTWTDKPERNGYYSVKTAGAALREYVNDTVTSSWKIALERLGAASEVDLQSRLTGVVRLNDFSLTGETWHAPPIGHTTYYTGATSPSTMTRTGADGAMTVYRSIPTNASPRWGCDPAAYLAGRVRINDTLAATGTGFEIEGTEQPLPVAAWTLGNALVNIVPSASAGVLDVQAYTGGAWHSKLWNVTVGGANVAAWDSAAILRNDPEQCVLRLTAPRSPGRVTLDLTLRRGSRTVEGYLQSGAAATLAVYLRTTETNTSVAASGYVVATNNDADGNKFAAGSARSFTAHANGGVSKTSTATLDFWLGVVAGGSSAVSGDAATDLRNMYIGALAEQTYTVRR